MCSRHQAMSDSSLTSEAPSLSTTYALTVSPRRSSGAETIATSAAPAAQGQGLELAVSAAIYRTDGTVRRAEALQAHPLNTGARIVLNPSDAQAAGVADGQVAKVGNGIGTAALPVVVDARVAVGAAWIESGYGATAPLGAGRVTVVSA